MRRPAGILEHGNFIIERLPPSAEYISARDNDVDLVGARLDGAPDLGDSFGKRRKTGRESRRDRGHVNPASFDSTSRRFDERVVHPHSPNLERQLCDAKLLYD